MSISKDDVMSLRDKTGAGLIDCKRALTESNGNMDEAVSILRKKGVATAAKKSGRSASEGIIAQSISSDRSRGILVEVNCETDFVAKNDDFVVFARSVAGDLLENPDADLEEKRTEQVAKIGENIQISRSQFVCTSQQLHPCVYPVKKFLLISFKKRRKLLRHKPRANHLRQSKK
jgi:elongation factor Ts